MDTRHSAATTNLSAAMGKALHNAPFMCFLIKLVLFLNKIRNTGILSVLRIPVHFTAQIDRSPESIDLYKVGLVKNRTESLLENSLPFFWESSNWKSYFK